MKVVYKLSESQQWILAHGSERGVGLHVGPDGEASDFSRLVQQDPILGATYQRLADKGNILRQYGFSVNVELATGQAAQLFVLDYPQTLPAKGELHIVTYDENGVATIRRLNPAVLRGVRMSRTGVNVNVRYDFLATEVQNVSA